MAAITTLEETNMARLDMIDISFIIGVMAVSTNS